MKLKHTRLAIAFCLLLIVTFITSSLIATLTKPLENAVSVFQSLLTQQYLLLTTQGESCADDRQRCVLNIGIDDSELNSFFSGKTPLDPLALLDGIRQIPTAGTDPQERPAALVLDLDLSYGKDDKEERNQLFDGMITLSQIMPVILSCPRNFAERPEQLGAPVQDYIAYVTRHNAANVAKHGGIYFFNPGIDRFALNYDSSAPHAGRVLEVALNGNLAARQQQAAAYQTVCRNSITAEYGSSGDGTRLLRPDERYIRQANWHALHDGSLQLNYGNSIVLIGSNYLGADMFTFLSANQLKSSGLTQVSGAHLHAYVISDYLSPSRDTPAVFNALFDVLLGLLSGVVFCWLWRRVKQTGQHYAANLIAHMLFFAFAIVLPLSLMLISAVLLVNGTGFVAAGMVISALLDAFFTPQEVEAESAPSVDGSVALPRRLALLATGLLLGGVLFMSYQFSNEQPWLSTALPSLWHFFSQTLAIDGRVYHEHLLALPVLLSLFTLRQPAWRSNSLLYLAALSTAAYFLILAFHADTLPPLAGLPQYAWLGLPLLMYAIRLFAHTTTGQAACQYEVNATSEWLRDLFASPNTPLLLMVPLAYWLANMPPLIELGSSLGLIKPESITAAIPLPLPVILGLPIIMIGTIPLYWLARQCGHAIFDSNWCLLDMLAFSIWEGSKGLIAIDALVEATTGSNELPWPYVLALIMLLAITLSVGYDWWHARRKASTLLTLTSELL